MKEITPYLNFDGNCREAMNFYQKAIGGELQVMTFGDTDPNSPPATKDRLMHARLAKGSLVLMASDTQPGTPFIKGNNVWLTLVCESDQEVEKAFSALGAGGKALMAPHDAFWGARFAMLSDRFGLNWMLSFGKPSSKESADAQAKLAGSKGQAKAQPAKAKPQPAKAGGRSR